jgi:type IV pilus assembly protein PilM
LVRVFSLLCLKSLPRILRESTIRVPYMPIKPTSNQALGIHLEGGELRHAFLSGNSNEITIQSLTSTKEVKQLDLPAGVSPGNTLIASTVGSEVLFSRSLKLPGGSFSKLESIVPFQAEPLLPFPLEDAILDWQVISKSENSLTLSLLAVQKKQLKQHLESFSAYKVNPEATTTSSAALAQFVHQYYPSEKQRIVINFGHNHSLVTLVSAGFVQETHHIAEELESARLNHKLQQAVTAMERNSKGAREECVFLTGETDTLPSLPFSNQILENANYAIAIGTALSYLDSTPEPLNLRQGEFAYETPLRRYQQPAFITISLSIALALLLWLSGNSWLNRKEESLKTDYYELLTALNKTPHQIDTEIDRSPDAPPSSLSFTQIRRRTQHLETLLRGQADTFPLKPNLPQVSDLLAWLATHPEILKEGELPISIQSLSYTMVKRPEASNKRQRYQVRVELDFSAATPRRARELHDSLRAPNAMVDPKTDVKWSTSQDLYKAVFLLKDRTSYLTSILPGVVYVA